MVENLNEGFDPSKLTNEQIEDILRNYWGVEIRQSRRGKNGLQREVLPSTSAVNRDSEPLIPGKKPTRIDLGRKDVRLGKS